MAKKITNVVVGFKRPITEEKLKQLPNHLKSIMLINSANGIVRPDKIRNFQYADIIEKSEQESENKFDFEMLKQIERLAGYETDNRGNVLIKNPIWKVLTKKDYEGLVGKEIVCRMIKYENKDIGIELNKGLSTPSYDDYFILIPQKTNEEIPRQQKTFEKKKIEEKIFTAIKDALPGLEIVERDKRRTSKEVVLTNLANKFTIVDLDEPIQIITRESKKNVKVKGKNIEVSTNMIVDALALDCQVNNIEQEFMSNNLIGIQKFDDITQRPEVIQAIIQKRNEIVEELDEIEDDRCSAFGKFRPKTNAGCVDKD